MKSSTAVLMKFEGIFVVLALIGAAIQLHKSGWRSALFIFAWMFVLLNIPLLWYVGKSLFGDWRKSRRS